MVLGPLARSDESNPFARILYLDTGSQRLAAVHVPAMVELGHMWMIVQGRSERRAAAYPLGRMVRRIRSTKSVRTAEW